MMQFRDLAGVSRLPPTNSRTRLGPMSVLQALDWAFRREHAQLELPERAAPEDRGQGFGMEYVLLQRAKLGGVKIDEFGSRFGGSEPHDDAEVVAAIVSNLPDDLGGLHMAIRLSEHARAGQVPDWMPGAVPRMVPRDWAKANQHGQTAQTEVIGSMRYVDKRRVVNFQIVWCPVTLDPHPQKIASLRAAYTEWWFAVSYVRRTLRDCGMLREISITGEMPPMAPWTAET